MSMLIWPQRKHISIPVGTLVGLTLLVVVVGSTELVEIFVDDLVAVSITIRTYTQIKQQCINEA